MSKLSSFPIPSQRFSFPPAMPVPRTGRRVALGLLAAAALCQPAISRAAIVLQDDFDYATDVELQANWTTLAENSPTMVQASTAVTGAPFGSLANGVIQRPLLETVSNFTLTIDLISSESERRQSVGVFDASGRNGYFFSIDNGYLLVNEVSIPEATPLTRQAYYDNMTVLSSGAGIPGSSEYFAPVLYVNPGLVNFFPSGPASNTPMTTFTFSLQEDGTIQLSADGNLIFTGNDTTLASFSSVVIIGNTFGYFNDLTVEAVPEPATTLLVGAGIVGFALRRRPTGVDRRTATR